MSRSLQTYAETFTAAAVDVDLTFNDAVRVHSVALKINTAPTTSESLVIAHDAIDGAAYDTTLRSVDLSTYSATSIVWQSGRRLARGDILKLDYTNTDGRTIGVVVYYDNVSTADTADGPDQMFVNGALLGSIDADIGKLEVANVPLMGTTVDVDFDGSVASAAVVAAGPVMLCATEDCYCVWGATPTAAAAAPSWYLPAGVMFVVESDGTKIAAIKKAVAGKLSITPLT
ncbi:MAG: hypothetical protein GY851_09195 [bacterium]|nr:hypothetical protein [bacterium]